MRAQAIVTLANMTGFREPGTKLPTFLREPTSPMPRPASVWGSMGKAPGILRHRQLMEDSQLLGHGLFCHEDGGEKFLRNT
jgi:hypothetical protein